MKVNTLSEKHLFNNLIDKIDRVINYNVKKNNVRCYIRFLTMLPEVM
jgi:hypothetical protein